MQEHNNLEESFSNASYMDVRELRVMYYGRVNMYASFTDNSEYETPPDEVPDGILAYSVDSVVGRKVSSEKFYAKVFRAKKSGGRFVEDIRDYSREDLVEDVSILQITHDDAEQIYKDVMADGRIRRDFDRFWKITWLVAKKNQKKWNKILRDLGYIGFEDRSGVGVLVKKKTPVALFLDKKQQSLDIVPIQRYRKDERARVKELVDYRVRKQAPVRNRISKKNIVVRKDAQKDRPNASVLDTIFDLITGEL